MEYDGCSTIHVLNRRSSGDSAEMYSIAGGIILEIIIELDALPMESSPFWPQSDMNCGRLLRQDICPSLRKEDGSTPYVEVFVELITVLIRG